MRLYHTDEHTTVVVEQDHVRRIRGLLPRSGLPRTAMLFRFSTSGTLLDVQPAGCKGPGVDRLANAARREMEREARPVGRLAHDTEGALL